MSNAIRLERVPSNVVAVAEALREAIVAGRLRAGERIKEAPLAEQLGISRGPIRDALRLLQADGLLDILPNRGAVVPEVQAADVFEVYSIRACLGSLALHKLMMDSDKSAAKELESALRRFEAAVERGDDRRAADADLVFQETIVRKAGMPRVTREFERLTWQLRMFIATLDMRYADKLPIMLEEIRALYGAIIDGRMELAEQLWREKFERWVRDLIAHLPGDGGFDRDLWVALTAGAQGSAMASPSSGKVDDVVPA